MSTAVAPQITEKAFQAQVVQLAKVYHWEPVYHTFDSRRSCPGFPDLVMLRGKRIIYAELKTEHGKLSMYQSLWLEALRKVPQNEVFIWRPSDFDDIEKVLR